MSAPVNRRCPECRRSFAFRNLKEQPYAPFCSERCKLIDLGRWLSDEYAVVEDLNLAHQQEQPEDGDD
jgi:uncharacterized protein